MDVLYNFVLLCFVWSTPYKIYGARDSEKLRHKHGKTEYTRHSNETKALFLLERVLNRVDNRIRPDIGGPPLTVKIDFYVQSFGSVNEVDMDFRIGVFIRQRWIDKRLAFDESKDPVVIPAHLVERFWLPDLFFPNEKEAAFHKVVVPQSVIKVFPNGLTRFSTRLTLKLSCPMSLVKFPLDNQDCFLKVESYSYTTKDLVLEWLNNDPMELNMAELQLPQFKMTGIETGLCEEKNYTTGRFSCLQGVFHLERQVGFYVLQTFIPSILIVVLSWVSFWINKNAVPARITLGVTTVLTMTTQLSSSRSSSMKVSYPKALDVWYTFCMTLVFCALVEFAFVNFLSREDKNRRAQQTKGMVRPSDQNSYSVVRNEMTVVELLPKSSKENNASPQSSRSHEDTNGIPEDVDDSSGYFRCPRSCSLSAEGLDNASRVLFPVAFLLFNILFWSVYSQKTEFGYNMRKG